MTSDCPVPPPAPRGSMPVAITLCAMACAWLVSRVFIGLDFTDEMQYYGEIASLVRTGKLFQADLFLQQLGYVFVWPFFRAHAVAFPDGAYLVLFGRVLLLIGYVVVGIVLWRSLDRSEFTRAQRVLAFAAFAAWIPFQLFALSYNSLAYLLVVALLVVRRTAPPLRRALLLTVLTYAYPPAGLALIALAAFDGWRHGGPRAAATLPGLTLAGGLLVLLTLRALHGPTFPSDLLLAINFSRGFTGGAILQWDGFTTCLLLAAAGALFCWRSGRPPPATAINLPAVVRLALALITTALLAGALLLPNGYLPGAGLLVVLVGFAFTLRADSPAAPRYLLLGGAVTLLLISARWATGYFAATAYVVLLALIAGSERARRSAAIRELVVVATILGTVVSFTSGNGVHNFGVGSAACLPLFVLHASRAAADWLPALRLARLAMPGAIVALILANGAIYPYREQRPGHRFERMRGVPAFAGLWTSPVKVQTVAAFQQLFPDGKLRRKRLLVVGPHPWLYFAAEAEPATPMFFMHFSVSEANYDVVARELFHRGAPEAILLTNAIPRSIHARLSEWVAGGCTAATLTLPEPLVARYNNLVRQDLGREITLLTRAAPPSERPPP